MISRKQFDTGVNDLLLSIGQLVRRVRAASASHDLSLTEYSVLVRLDKEGPATTADLARAEGMKPQSMGAAVAALEKFGFVERRPHPTDGRQMHIATTAKGAEVRRATRAAKRLWLGNAVSRLDEKDQAALFAAGEIMKRLVETTGEKP
jgi:DNA-binding MarR family transcriptional regulator